MVDKHLMDQMENILSRLTIPVAIMDKDPETWSATEQLPLEQISDGMIQSVRGVLYLGITQPGRSAQLRRAAPPGHGMCLPWRKPW